jgi:hypothetical protein
MIFRQKSLIAEQRTTLMEAQNQIHSNASMLERYEKKFNQKNEKMIQIKTAKRKLNQTAFQEQNLKHQKVIVGQILSNL